MSVWVWPLPQQMELSSTNLEASNDFATVSYTHLDVYKRQEWIQALAGQNNLQGNAVAVVFGVFMYFPTLVEVPVAKMFLDLGMHPGPLLAYLMADPELSLQRCV